MIRRRDETALSSKELKKNKMMKNFSSNPDTARQLMKNRLVQGGFFIKTGPGTKIDEKFFIQLGQKTDGDENKKTLHGISDAVIRGRGARNRT